MRSSSMNRRDFPLQGTVASATLIAGAPHPRETPTPDLRTPHVFHCPWEAGSPVEPVPEPRWPCSAKHGIESIGYWLPVNPDDQRLYVSPPVSEPRSPGSLSWKAFGEDPEWKAATRRAEAKRPLVVKVENPFLVPIGLFPGGRDREYIARWRVLNCARARLPRLAAQP